jgi:hypothetical protein
VTEHDDFANVNCAKTCEELLGYLKKKEDRHYTRPGIGGGITITKATKCVVGLRVSGEIDYEPDTTAAIAPTLPQTINDKLCDGTILIGYGKRGHGMNGRDADLDRIGQCLVKSLTTIAPEGCDHYKVLINLRLYASICAPTGEGIWWEELNESVSPELREFFKDHHGIDLATIDWEKDGETPHGPLGETPYEIVEEYFMEQATSIVCGMAPVGDFLFNDDCWDGGTDITLEVPLSVGEHEAIEAGDTDTLDTVAARIAKEIYDANEGGTPERDRLKLFEEEVGMVNDMVNGLECYGKKQETPA